VSKHHNYRHSVRLTVKSSPAISTHRSLCYNEAFPEEVFMPTAAKRKDEQIKVNQFLTAVSRL
jgi:hypothetical protein